MNLSDIGTKIIRKIREIEQQIRNLISDDVYSSSWDGITTIAPSKNAVYDKIELVVAGGEVNTGSNVGTDGIGVYDGKVGVDLQFRHIAPASSAITVVENGNDIDIDLSHLGIEDLGDAGADKILFWDDSESKTDWLVPNTGLVVDGTNLNCSITQYTNNDADARIAAASHDTLLNPNGNAEEQHMTSAQITALHAAVTVNAPIVLTGQDIELKNDANVQITEIDTGALAASDTTIPTSNTVKEAVDLRLLISEIDDTPVNGITNAPISSNWAFDHAANTTTAHGAVSAATASKHVVRDASGRAKFVASAANGDAVIHEQLHSAVTVTAPISITGQLIKLVNDAAATITEFDTSALAASDTKIPTNTTVKEYVDLLKEQSTTFPASPVEGDFHYDEDDDSLYRYNAEAEAWVEVGAGGKTTANNDASLLLSIKTLNTTERYNTASGYAKLKEILIQVSGTFTFYWKLRSNVGGYSVKSKLYVNGVATGAEKTTDSASYVDLSDSIEVVAGNLVQLYTGNVNALGQYSYAMDFYVNTLGNINWSY